MILSIAVVVICDQFGMKCITPKVWPQYLLTIICNIETLTFGLHTGWLAPLHLRLMSDESPVGRLTTEEISWIGSIPAVSFLVGTSLYGLLLQRVGRRLSALLAVLPNVACFVIFIFSEDVCMVYVGRFIAGFAAAGAILVTPVYVNECASDDVRGFLCGLSAFFVNVGVVIAAVVGGYFPYSLFNAVCLSFSLVFLFFYPWLPETPVFLLTRERVKEAGEALHKLRRGNKTEIESEITRLQNQLKERGATVKSLSDLLSDGTFGYAVFLSIGVMTFHQLCGCPSITAYSAKVFHDSGSTLSPAAASTGTSFMLLIGSVFGAFLMDKVGRKPLLVSSLTVMSVSLTVLSAFVYAEQMDGYGWVPAATLFTYMGTFASGIGSVSFVLITELFLPEVRGISGAVCGTWASILGFLTAKFFPLIVERVSLTPVLLAFALSCTTGAAFVQFFLVETRGKSPREVSALLKSRITKSTTRDMEMQSVVH